MNPDGTPDNNQRAYYGTTNGITPSSNGLTIDDTNVTYGSAAPVYTDCLKYTSQLRDFTHHLGVVYGGTEDCADVNNGCKNVYLEAKEWHSGGKYVFTVKGGSNEIDLAGTIVSPGKVVDVDLGNWSDQSGEKTKRVGLDLRRSDGKPVRVRVLHADRPKVFPGSGPYVYVFPSPDEPLHGFFVWFFRTFRRVFWK